MAFGKLLIICGIAIALLGIMLTWSPGLVRWFGKMPGDVAYEGDQVRAYFPVVSMLILSIVISFVVSIARRF